LKGVSITTKTVGFKINDKIKSEEVRLIDQDKKQVGVVPLAKALELAQKANLDLVEIGPNENPPVVRIFDYSKFKYDLINKKKQSRKNQSGTQLKEIRFRLKIETHDYEVKTNKVRQMLQGGDKVKVTVFLRGREKQKPSFGFELLEQIKADLSDISNVDGAQNPDAKNISVILIPTIKKTQTISQQKRTGREKIENRLERQRKHLAKKELNQKEVENG